MNDPYYHRLGQVTTTYLAGQQYLTSSRPTGGIFYYLLSTARLPFYLTILNSFLCNKLFISYIAYVDINCQLKEKLLLLNNLPRVLNNFHCSCPRMMLQQMITRRHVIIDFSYRLGRYLSII